MSEQSSEALNFGPQWIRDLSNGASVPVPPPSPGPSYKLAQFRYGKEEMLALFSKNLKPPIINKDVGDFILKKDACDPLAMMPLTEEEQRNSFGSLNSVAVLKMMGRGGQRGGRGMSRGGRGSGRGRGEQGFYRGFSQDDSSSNKTDEGWQRETISRKQSWGESTGRGGFGDRGRDTETSPRGYDPTAPPGRHSRALASGNWRSSEADDDGGGWVTPRGSVTPQGSERAERWRTSSRDSWHRDDHTRERRFSDRDRNSFEDVPEWSKTDNVFEPDSGSFDASGAFCVAKDKKPPDDSGDGGRSREDWDLEIDEENHNDESECDVITKDSDTPPNTRNKEPPGNDIEQQERVKAVASPGEDNTQPVMDEKAAGIASEPSHRISPREEHNIHAKIHQDEVGANLERVAESCIANLDVEGEEPSEEKLSSSLEMQGGERSVETKWFYRDPQGQEQGPFSNEEMVEWFHHGYFTMQLSVRRQCDAVYLSLGDLIKRWKRVPFMPGPSPPPVTHQQVINEQEMFMQQQLLQQHYQHLQKQAILQQIQQQQQLQQEQRQQAAESTLQLNFSSSENQPSRTVVSPRLLPTTTHSGSPIGAAEMIWGAEPQSPKDSWSPPENASSWNEAKRQTSPVPIEDIQIRERERELEKEKERERLEAENAEMLRRKEEEEKRQIAKKQEEERLKRIEEERRQQEKQKKAEAEKRKQEQAKKKMNATKEEQSASQWRGRGGMGRGKLYDMMEKEGRLGRRQEQDEEKLREELRKNGESEQRKKKSEGEKRKQEEAMKRSKAIEQTVNDEEFRREKDCVEGLEEEEIKEKWRKNRESNQQRKSKSNDSSRWATQNSAAMSLSEIQEQEEKNRMAHEEKMKELEAKQRQLQSAAAHGWSSEKLQTSNNIKSLKAIQDEQARQGPKQNKQSPRSQPTQASPAWNTTWTAGNNNVWTGNHNDREEDQETEYSNDVMRVHNTGKNQKQKNNVTKQAKQSTTKSVTNGKKSEKKSSKEEESVRKIFQQAASNDPFTEWCAQNLHGLATAVDVPTFIAFLRDLESPYEVHTYVREYIGDNDEAKTFAKEFIERQRSSEWKHVPTKTTSPPKHSTSSTVVARGGGAGPRSEPESSGGKTKKKKKQRMQKVDPSILGFSVNAAERVNMGEIQSVEDS